MNTPTTPFVGMGATCRGYSDENPFEVVAVSGPKRLKLRAMKAVLDPNWKPEMVPGGFSAVCVNNFSQKWVITSDASLPTVVVRLHKDGKWHDCHGNRYFLGEAAKFYDYNF